MNVSLFTIIEFTFFFSKLINSNDSNKLTIID